MSPLHEAARYGHTDLITIFVQEYKLPINSVVRSIDGRTENCLTTTTTTTTTATTTTRIIVAWGRVQLGGHEIESRLFLLLHRRHISYWLYGMLLVQSVTL